MLARPPTIKPERQVNKGKRENGETTKKNKREYRKNIKKKKKAMASCEVSRNLTKKIPMRREALASGRK